MSSRLLVRIKKEVEPFRHPERMSRKDYVLFFVVTSVFVAIAIAALINRGAISI